MTGKSIGVLLCFGFLSSAVAGTPGAVENWAGFDQGVDLRSFVAAAAASEIKAPTPERLRADIVAEFQTMGRHEGVRVDDNTALVTIDTQLAANGAPGFVQLEMRYQEIPKDKAALALDPDALTITVNLPLKYYPAIFEGDQFLVKSWEFGGKSVSAYSSYDGRTKFVQLTQSTRDSAGGIRTTEVLKLTVAGKEVSMGQLEKFSAGSDIPYFSEYIVMATKEAHGLALRDPDTIGRISDPALIKYAAESPTPQRFREVLGK